MANGYTIRWQAATHVGRVRGHNEDAWSVRQAEGGFFSAAGPTAEGRARDELLAVVSDGLGGENYGEVAAAFVAQYAEQLWAARPPAGTAAPPESITQWLQQRCERLHRDLDHRIRQESQYAGMGATLALVLVLWRRAWVAHVGDSRVFLVRSGRLQRLTRDHSLAERWRAEGVMTEEQIRLHPDRQVLEQVIGGPRSDAPIQPTIISFPLQKGDALLLCSDGLTNALAEEEIQRRLTAPKKPRWRLWPRAGRTVDAETVINLVEAAVEKDGRDNTTAVGLFLT